MRFSDNTIVDFSSDNTSATLTTDLVIDSTKSGTSGVTLAENTSGGNASGTHLCSRCHGAGGYNESSTSWATAGGVKYATTVYKWHTCPVCGGSGHVH